MSKLKKTMQIRDALVSGVSSVGRIYRLDPMYLFSLSLSFFLSVVLQIRSFLKILCAFDS